MIEPQSFKQSRGFTLIEVLAALLIASFVILTITNLFINATHHVTMAREDTTAALYVQEKIEGLLHLNRGASELDAGEYFDDPAPGYRRSWKIYDDNPSPGAKMIVVKVTPGNGASRPVVFAVIRAR